MGVRVAHPGHISAQIPQTVYTSLGMSLQLKWKYIQCTVSEVGHLINPVERALREDLFSGIFWVGRWTAAYMSSCDTLISAVDW